MPLDAAAGRRVAVLCARRRSVYRRFAEADVYDAERGAYAFRGGVPVVAHPPCRAWGRLRAFAAAPPAELELALWCCEQVRAWGGVLEHPRDSRLWGAAGLPLPNEEPDAWGGWTLNASQYWFGHAAEKRTWFYIVGVGPGGLPEIPFRLAGPELRPLDRLSRRQREGTPEPLAHWLVELAARCGAALRPGEVAADAA